MTEIFIAPRGQLTQPSKVALRKAGVVVVEVTNPAQCKFLRASEELGSDEMLWAAMNALSVSDTYGNKGALQREKLATNLIQIVEQNRKKEQE